MHNLSIFSGLFAWICCAFRGIWGFSTRDFHWNFIQLVAALPAHKATPPYIRYLLIRKPRFMKMIHSCLGTVSCSLRLRFLRFYVRFSVVFATSASSDDEKRYKIQILQVIAFSNRARLKQQCTILVIHVYLNAHARCGLHNAHVRFVYRLEVIVVENYNDYASSMKL